MLFGNVLKVFVQHIKSLSASPVLILPLLKKQSKRCCILLYSVLQSKALAVGETEGKVIT